MLRIYTNVSKNSEVIVPLGGSQELWFVKNSAWANDFDAVSSNTYYVTTDMSNESNGYVTVNGVKESYYKENSGVPIKVTLTGGKDYYVNISVRGDLYDIVHGNTTNFATYIGNQQAALTNLNNLITAGNPANVRRFFTLTTPIITPNINTLDNIDASEFEDSKLDALYPNRIMTYGGSYFNATDMQSLTNLCNLLKREILVGDFNNLNDNTVQKTDAEGNLIYDDQGAPVYYTADELIVDAINTNKTALGLPVDNKYYTTNVAGVEYGLEIRKVLKNTTFANQADLKDRIDDATVMTVLKNVDAADTLIEMFETYQGPTQINLTAADLAKLTEIKANSTVKNQFIQSLNLVKSTYTMPTQIQAFISAYVIPTVTPSPSPTPRPIQGGGGGGGFSSVKTPVNEPKQEDNTVSEKGQVFSDVPIDYWGYEAIRYMYAKKAVSGYPNGTFDPDNTLTKAELIQMIVNLFKIEAEIPEDYVNPFEDVNEDDWFYKSVITANVYGIFSGDGVRTNPNAPINRQEMATIIYRVLEKSGKTLSRENEVIKFSDEDNISDWAYTAIAKMQAAGIISGSNGMFDPRGNSTRAMAAQMLYKAMQGFEVPAETEE